MLPVLLLSFGIAAPAFSQETCKAPEPIQHALEEGLHVPNCSGIAYTHYPPTTGRHFPAWAKFRTYTFTVHPGYWLHSAEHGAVVLLVNCRTSGNCDEDFARLQRIADAVPQDPLCDTATGHRILIAEDTLIRTRFAAVAWGWSLESECADSSAFAAFIQAHYAKTEEDFCSGGTDFSGAGWCNSPLGLAAGGATDGPTPGDPDRPGAGSAARTADGKTILWAGSLARRGRLSVEMSSLAGKRLGRYDLGEAGPGPAQAAWRETDFRKGPRATGTVALRVTFTSAEGTRRLSESIVTEMLP
jgi:hypothetical protein